MRDLHIIAKVHKGNKIVGYIIMMWEHTHHNYQYVSKLRLWEYIKDNRFKNVSACGTKEAPIIKGNGNFKLSELYSFKWHENINNISEINTDLSDMDIHSSFIRYILEGNKVKTPIAIYEVDYLATLLAKNEIAMGKLNKTNKNILSENLVITNSIVDFTQYQGKLKVDYFTVYDRYAILGYRLKNIGNKPIKYNRYNKDASRIVETKTINPRETADLSVVDLVMLASKPEINGLLANAEMCIRHIPTNMGNLGLLGMFHFKFSSFDYRGLPVDIKGTISNSMYDKDIMLDARKIGFNIF